MNAPEHDKPDGTGGIPDAFRHALAWLVFGNTVGLLLSVLLLKPAWHPGTWSYGHWVPVHLNAQLYGWTALPLVGWLLSIYQVDLSKVRAWGPAAVWAWTTALGFACFKWLSGESSGKIFLDWRNSSLWCFVAALVILWTVLAMAWKERTAWWTRGRRRSSLAGLVVLASVPLMMLAASSPDTYPPVDRTTGGPTGSSLLGSSLFVVGLLLLLPRTTRLQGRGKAGLGTWIYFGFSWLAFGVTEAIGGGHFDSWQIGAMLLLLPWAWLIHSDWSGFHWPPYLVTWRRAMLLWWALLVASGVAMYSPGILDHIKFTQGLVAHAHLAMAGFTTAFCATLISLVGARPLGGTHAVVCWNLAAFLMILTLATMGWREGDGSSWMIVHTGWRHCGLVIRAICGGLMLGASILWLGSFLKNEDC